MCGDFEFGDDYNDREMLGECGVGIAVSNGNQVVKAIADDICESNEEDGVAKWIYHNLLARIMISESKIQR